MKKPQAKAQPKTNVDELCAKEYPFNPTTPQIANMTKAEAMDIIYQIVAESKKQIARGEYFTIEESVARRKWGRENTNI